MPERIAYRRVSSTDQNTARQLDGMTFDTEYEDRVSGGTRNRPALLEALKYCRKYDTLVVHSMDRLARNLGDLLALVQELNAKGVAVEFVKEHLTFTNGKSDPMAVLMLQVMGACAEFERSMIRERQREGIAIAQAAGKYKGRPKALTAAQIAEIRAKVASKSDNISDLAEEYNVSRQTLYTALKA